MAKIQVGIEALRADFQLYARTCLKIGVKGGDLVPLRLNHSQRKVQEAIDWCIAENRPPRLLELKARQTGLSTDAAARLFHYCHLNQNRSALVIAHKRDSAKAIFRMSRRFYRNLPEALRPPKRHFTTGEIEFADNDSRLQIEVATVGGGRGYTAQRVHLSEFAFYPNPATVLLGVLNSVPDTPDSLVIIESTANGMNEFYDMWVEAKKGENDFVPVFIPWFDEPGYRLETRLLRSQLTGDEIELMERHSLDLQQIAWRRWAIRNKCRGDLQLWAQEYPSDDREAFLASGRRVFDADAVRWYCSFAPPEAPPEEQPTPCDIAWNDATERPELIEWDQGPLTIFEPPIERHLYIAGVDPSEGDPGSDFSPIVVIDRMTLNVVAVWHGKKRPDRLAHVTRALATHFNLAHVVWEANNHGLSFQFEFERLYSDYYMRETSLESVARAVSDKPGFQTSTKTRHFLVNTLRQYINDKMGTVRHPALIAEITTFYYDEKDKPDHQPGKSSDLLFALALALEAHRGSPEADLEPLSIEQADTLRAHLRRRRVARSMGLDTPEPVNRFGITAHEYEELDAADERDAKRLTRIGVGTAA